MCWMMEEKSILGQETYHHHFPKTLQNAAREIAILLTTTPSAMTGARVFLSTKTH